VVIGSHSVFRSLHRNTGSKSALPAFSSPHTPSGFEQEKHEREQEDSLPSDDADIDQHHPKGN
jgi:hypothetical protein